MGLPPYNPLGALPQTPLRGFPLRLPSPLRGGFKQLERNQVSLRFLILAFFMNRFAIWGVRGERWGCRPKPCLGGIPPQTPFSASRRF